MSGSPSWALYEPSANSTSECTTLWGWITASILEYGSPYSHLASMTSNALLTSVAESIVIFGPMRQVGCAQRLVGRHARPAIAASRPRNGPPLAVSTRRATSAIRSPDQALPDRGVLAVDRAQPVERVAAELVEQPRPRGGRR